MLYYFNLYQYRHIFGRPYESVHKYRIPIVDLAAVDVILTIAAGSLISYFFETNLIKTNIYLFLLGIFLHFLFGVKTKLTVKISEFIVVYYLKFLFNFYF